MKTKDMVVSAVLLAVGTMLHFIIPGIVNGVKPDFMLATMFMAIIIFPNIKNTLAVGGAAAILTALTTNFPGGEIPSIFDKFISALFVLALIKALNINSLEGKKALIAKIVLFFTGTLVSGFIFLGSGLLLVGLPGGVGLGAMMVAIVLPTCVANVVFGLILDRAVSAYGNKIYA